MPSPCDALSLLRDRSDLVRRNPRVILLIVLAVAALAVLLVFKMSIMIAGGKAMIALVILAGLAWLILRPGDEKR